MNRAIPRTFLGGAVAALLLAAGAASAQVPVTQTINVSARVVAKCTVASVTDVKFGDLDAFQAPFAPTTGGLTVNCTKGAPFYVNLTAGGNAGATRNMKDGTSGALLSYELYRTAAETTAWYDGNNGTVNYTGTGAGKLPANVVTIPIVGKILDADPAVGTYADTVTAEIYF